METSDLVATTTVNYKIMKLFKVLEVFMIINM